MLKHRGRFPTDLRRGGRKVWFLVHKGRRIFPFDPVAPLPKMEMRTVTDATGFWAEVAFTSPEVLTGSAEAGWTDPRGYCNIRLESSTSLAAWAAGDFTDCAGSPTENEDGTFTYWSRCTVPIWWIEVMVDYTLGSDRYGKSIESLQINGEEIALDYPYAMPAAAATLQADLRTAGYTGATVTSTTAALSVQIKNHTVDGRVRLTPTLSGTSVTAVAFRGTAITLPFAPYAMPSQQAALQADLRAAGWAVAVVMLFGDPWEIILPDRDAVANPRQIFATISPGDPFPFWNFFREYQGLNQANAAVGSAGNVRDPYGTPLLEAGRNFYRLHITKA